MAAFAKGNKYQYWYKRVWLYMGFDDSKGVACSNCLKNRQKLHWFQAEDNPNDLLMLGTECVNEMRPYRA